jgi:hypothetical protein
MAAVDFLEVRLEETPFPENPSTSGTPYRLATEKLYMKIRSGKPSPGPEYLERGDELGGVLAAVPPLIEVIRPGGSIGERVYIKHMLWLLSLNGYDATVTQGAGGGTNEAQTLTMTGTPTGGTFTLTYTNPAGTTMTTAPIAYNATGPGHVFAALSALGILKTEGSDVKIGVSGGPFPGTPIVVTFQGSMGARNQVQMTADSTGLTGGSTPTVTPTTTTPGVSGSVTDPEGATLPATVYRWVFLPRASGVSQTAQMIWNYAAAAMQIKGNGYCIPSLTLNMAGELTADLLGLVYRRLAVDTTTVPTILSSAIPPLRRADLYVSWLANGGPIADFSLTSAMPQTAHPTASLDPPSNFPDQMLMGEEDGSGFLRLTGSIPKRALAAADIDALLAASTFAAKARWTTPAYIGATNTKRAAWCEMPACVLRGGEPGDLSNRRRVDATFDFEAHYDEASGFGVKWTLLSDTASIKTFV